MAENLATNVKAKDGTASYTYWEGDSVLSNGVTRDASAILRSPHVSELLAHIIDSTGFIFMCVCVGAFIWLLFCRFFVG